MANISLSSTEVTNLKAYLDSLDCAQNQRPEARAGNDQTVKDEDGDGKETVALDGSGSSDAEDSKNQLTYLWTLDGKTLGNKQKVNYSFAVGTHQVKLKVTDTKGASDEDTTKIVVEEQAAPEKKPAEKGKELFTSKNCTSCHATKDISGAASAPDLTCAGDKVVRNLGSLNEQMSNISLSNDDVTNLKAYLNSFSDCNSNQKPQAKAGTYATVKDEDGDGKETVALDGSGSSDAEDNKSELTYLWTLDGETLGDKQKVNYSFSVGTHQVKLKVTDTRGASDEDTAKIVVEKQAAPEKKPAEIGKELFSSKNCSSCHITKDISSANTTSDLTCDGDKVVKNLGSINDSMSSISLSNDDVTNLKAYLNSFNCNTKPPANTPPVVKIKEGDKITRRADSVNSSGRQYVRFSLDGSESYDNETPKNKLKYEWNCAEYDPVGFEAKITWDFTVGQCEWKLKVIDEQGASSTKSILVTILEMEESSGSAEIEKGSYSFDEGAGRVRLNLKRTGGTSGELKLHFKIEHGFKIEDGIAGYADYGEDFKAIDGDDNITFRDGVSSASISFDLIDDSKVEGDEQFQVVLYSGHEDEISNPQRVDVATVTLKDNDEAATNSPPTARAGNDQSFALSKTQTKFYYTLSAEDSTDDKGFENLSFQWAFRIGDKGEYSGNYSNEPAWQVEDRMAIDDVERTITWKLTVTDADGASDEDFVTIKSSRDKPDPAKLGEAVYNNKCSNCHTEAYLKEPSRCAKIKTDLNSISPSMANVEINQTDVNNLKAYLGCG